MEFQARNGRPTNSTNKNERARATTKNTKKSGVFWFVVYRTTARRHLASFEMDSGHWALRSLSFPGRVPSNQSTEYTHAISTFRI